MCIFLETRDSPPRVAAEEFDPLDEKLTIIARLSSRIILVDPIFIRSRFTGKFVELVRGLKKMRECFLLCIDVAYAVCRVPFVGIPR